MSSRHLILTACVASLLGTCGALTAPAARAAATDAERHETYKTFRADFDAGRFTAALPIAQRLVEMTEAQYGPDDRQLVNPLTNLGTVYYRLGDYTAAEVHYLRALRLIDGKLAGDVHPDVWEVAGHVSPNPGGVGPLTRAFLLANVVEAEEAKLS